MAYSNENPIVIWAYGKYVNVAQKAIEYYKEINSSTEFNVEEIPPWEIYNRLLNNDTVANIILVDNQELKKYLEDFPQIFAKLDDYVDTSRLCSAMIESITYDENIYGCPISSEPIALYYNKNELGELGEEITWDDFIELGKQVKEDTGKYLLPPFVTILKYLMQETGDMHYDSDGNILIDDSQDVKDVIDKINNPVLFYPVERTESNSEIDYNFYINEINVNLMSLLQNEEILSVIGGPDLFTIIKENCPDQNWGVTKIPVSDALSNNVILDGHSWLVLDKEYEGEDQSEVFAFLREIWNTDHDFTFDFVHDQAEQYDIVPVKDCCEGILDGLTNNGCFDPQEVIKYLYSLLSDAIAISFREDDKILWSEGSKYFGTQNPVPTDPPALPEPPTEPDPPVEPEPPIEKELTSIKILTNPEKLIYNDGEQFDPTGMVVQAYYNNASFQKVSNEALETPYVKFEEGENETNIVISYSEGNVTKETSLTVYRKTGEDLEGCDIQQNMGESGVGTVNLYSGNFKYSFNDFMGNDPNFPISISHIYSKNFERESCFGSYWRLNVEQELEKIDGKWQYTDNDGKKHLFSDEFEAANERSSVRNEKLGLDLFENGNTIKLIDRGNNTLVFTKFANKYKLTEMHMYPSKADKPIDTYSLKVIYDNSNGRISEIVAGSKIGGKRPTVKFDYFGDGLLSKLQYGYKGLVDDETDVFTTVVKYEYIYADTVAKLSAFTITNKNVNTSFSRRTEFVYDKVNEIFSVSDLSSKNASGTAKKLVYSTDKKAYVSDFSIGYGENEQEKTHITYVGSRYNGQDNSGNVDSNENDQIHYSNETAATIVEYNGTTSVITFNDTSVVAQYSYEISWVGYEKPSRVNSAQASGFSYMSFAATYSDTFDVFHDDFEKDKNGWCSSSGSIVGSVNKRISGSCSLCGNNLTKTYIPTSNKEKDKTYYLSLWLLNENDNATDITVTVKYDSTEAKLIHSVDNGLKGMWQYVAFCLGESSPVNEITIAVSNKQGDVYIDDVRMVVSPYNVAKEKGSPQYDSFGNVIRSSRYNPIDKKFDTTTYEYDSNHQLLKKTETGLEYKNEISNYYDDGLLSLQCYRGLDVTGTTRPMSHSYEYVTALEGEAEPDKYKSLKSEQDCNRVTTFYDFGTDYKEAVLSGKFISKGTSNLDDLNQDDINQKETYYKNSGALKTLSSGELKNEFAYNENGNLSKAKFGYNANDKTYNTEMDFGYDSFGNVNTVSIGGENLITADYDYKHLNKITYANGDGLSYDYDSKDRVSSIKETHTDAETGTETQTDVATMVYNRGDSDSVEIVNNSGVKYSSKSVNSNNHTREYNVHFADDEVDGKPSKYLKVAGFSMIEEPFSRNVIDYYVDDSNTPFEKCFIAKNGSGKLDHISRKQTSILYNAPTDSMICMKNTYAYDELNRISQKTTAYQQYPALDVTDKQYERFSTDYEYSGSGTKVEKEVFRFKYNPASPNDSIIKSIEYEYYNNGNLASVKYDGSLLVKYKYDKFGRLIEEYNDQLGIKYSFEYDNNGNILKRDREYISSNDILSDVYDYTTVRIGCNQNSAWGDQLKTYNKKAVEYDKLGNITRYRGKRLEWNGKNLLSINGCVIMDYDHNGLRVKKTFDGYVKKYYWCDNRLIMERWKENGTEKYIYYYYDESGVCGMRYVDGTKKEDYHYLKNIFGDILGIYSTSGECLCKYVYDAWGRHKVFDNNGEEITDNNNIGIINPFRYRGYYYDFESELYYLQSRYYDPLFGRFLNSDLSAINPQSIFGFNTYAFCDNNPIACTQDSFSSGNSIVNPFLTINGDFPTIPNSYGEGSNIFNSILVSGSFRNGLVFGKGTVTGLYASGHARAQVSLKNGKFVLGVSGKFSLLNATGQIGIGNKGLSFSLLGVGDIGTMSGVAGIIIDPSKNLYYAGIEAKAAVFTARGGVQFEIFGTQIEIGGSVSALSVGLQFGIKIENGEFYYKSGLALLFGYDYYIRIKFL